MKVVAENNNALEWIQVLLKDTQETYISNRGELSDRQVAEIQSLIAKASTAISSTISENLDMKAAPVKGIVASEEVRELIILIEIPIEAYDPSLIKEIAMQKARLSGLLESVAQRRQDLVERAAQVHKQKIEATLLSLAKQDENSPPTSFTKGQYDSQALQLSTTLQGALERLQKIEALVQSDVLRARRVAHAAGRTHKKAAIDSVMEEVSALLPTPVAIYGADRVSRSRLAASFRMKPY